MSKLAIFNAKNKVRSKPFSAQETIGKEESKAVTKFLGVRGGKSTPNYLSFYEKKPILSAYRGTYNEYFMGGEQVQALEKEFANKFNAKHALAVNSCTSALIIACGAIGIQPGDEVIVTPWSMTCSATAPMIYGGIPVFADIEEDYYCLNPEDIKNKITSKTKAIIVVDLFGQPFAKEIINITKENNLYIIEDAAQAIGSCYRPNNASNGFSAGTLGDIGCFSFTQGKLLTSGEGGMITTNNDELAMKCALIRNHAESVTNDMQNAMEKNPKEHSLLIKYVYNTPNMVGFNMRMTEIQAIILREQLKKLDRFIQMREFNVRDINEALKDIPAIILANEPRENCTHSYYVQGFKWDSSKADGIHRDKFVDAVVAELAGEEGRADRPMIGKGYIKPLYLMPIFQHTNYWSMVPEHILNYEKGTCPTAERLWQDEFFLSMYHNLPLTKKDVKDIQSAFWKVWENREELK